jgi:hypothetical protein
MKARLTARDKYAAKTDALWEELRAMPDRQQLGVLYYLVGYCKSVKKFAEGLESAIVNQKTEVSR